MSAGRPSFESNEQGAPLPPPQRHVPATTATAANPPPLPARHDDALAGDRVHDTTATTTTHTHETATGRRDETISEPLDSVDQGVTGAWHTFHGAGEQIRGSLNRFFDQMGDRIAGRKPNKNMARNDETIAAGSDEVHHGVGHMEEATDGGPKRV